MAWFLCSSTFSNGRRQRRIAMNTNIPTHPALRTSISVALTLATAAFVQASDNRSPIATQVGAQPAAAQGAAGLMAVPANRPVPTAFGQIDEFTYQRRKED